MNTTNLLFMNSKAMNGKGCDRCLFLKLPTEQIRSQALIIDKRIAESIFDIYSIKFRSSLPKGYDCRFKAMNKRRN